MNLESMIEAARDQDAPELRGFDAVERIHEHRVARGRAVRRVLGAASAAAIVATLLFRAGSSSADVRAEVETAVAMNDAGYARD